MFRKEGKPVSKQAVLKSDLVAEKLTFVSSTFYQWQEWFLLDNNDIYVFLRTESFTCALCVLYTIHRHCLQHFTSKTWIVCWSKLKNKHLTNLFSRLLLAGCSPEKRIHVMFYGNVIHLHLSAGHMGMWACERCHTHIIAWNSQHVSVVSHTLLPGTASMWTLSHTY